ncbi:BON domain-containing protein [Variovorax soli]|uniref:BON domain-containing protein n=1 Tax=Variovorax soli TaxID=376815 RepID=UPI00083831BB|nr:BON domain-containing protein [Variovorax soli]
MKTDAQLQNDVEAELAWDPQVTHTNVGVLVKDGVVTLTGYPASHSEKYAIERATQRVAGVRAIAVELEVRLPQDDVRPDGDIALAAKRALTWNALLADQNIGVMVEKGDVILSGEVEWQFQRRAAEAAVRPLLGVTAVTNQIVVNPRISADNIAAKIDHALARQAHREAHNIQVIVDGASVTLRGQVHSWAEWRAAQGVAWSAPGIATVNNDLLVVV